MNAEHLPVPEPRSCPVCEGTETELLLDHRLAPIEGVSLHAGYRVVACSRCGMVYAEGIPSQAAFDRYYALCSRYEDQSRMGYPSRVDQARFQAIADELAKQLPDCAGSIVELGCSTGGLLDALKKRGFQALLGVDPSPLCGQTAQALYGLRVEQGTVFAPVQEGPHDVLIAVGVVEHLRDLHTAMANFARALKPGGLLYLEVPDLEGFHRTNEAPFQEFSTEHINFFTQTSLRNLLGRHGFQPAFGHIVQRRHGGGSTMQVIASAFRRRQVPDAFTPERDLAGPLAARAYRELGETQAQPERELMHRLAEAGVPIAVWGAGTVACRWMATTDLPRTPIAAFLDSNPHLQGHHLGGVMIHPPSWLQGFAGPVLVASRGYAAEIQDAIRNGLGLANPLLML